MRLVIYLATWKIRWRFISAVLAVLLVISLYFNLSKGGITGRVTAESAGNKAVTFINSYLLQGESAALISVDEQSDVYVLNLDINGQPGKAFVTLDGSLLFINPIDLNSAPLIQNESIEVSADDAPIEGDPEAPITIVEFSDFQCPFCKRFFDEVYPDIKSEFIDTGIARLAFRNFPLDIHPDAEIAAEAAQCAYEQGSFWEYHNILFENQDDLSVDALKSYASEITTPGFSISQFDDCLDTGKYAPKIAQDIVDGTSYGVSGVPTFFINGVKITGVQPFSLFNDTIYSELAS